ncbi:MAG: hypothetical protein ABIJ41_00255 [Candidatus Omnitrophota bacterium]
MIKVEILAPADKNTEYFEKAIKTAARGLNMEIQIMCTSNFAAYTKHSINPSQSPIVLINGNVEFTSQIPDPETIKRKLTDIRNQAGSLY